MDLFSRYHFVVSLLSSLFQLIDFKFIPLFDSIDMNFFLGQPYLIEFKQCFFNTVLGHFLIFKFHLQHDFIAGSRTPYKSFVYLDFRAATGPFLLYLLVKRIVLQSFVDVPQIVNLLKIFSKVAKLFVLISIFQKKDKPINCFFSFIEFQQLSTSWIFP